MAPRIEDKHKNFDPARRRTTRAEKECDKGAVAHLMRRGMSQGMIAETLGVSVKIVQSYYEVCLRELRETRNEETKQLVDMKLEEYRELKAEAWSAWEKSKEDAKVISTEDSVGPRGDTTKSIERIEGRCGDSTYLRIVIDCLSAERELLALNPIKEMRLKQTSVQVNWDVFTNGLPPDGTVPDEVEDEIKKALGLPCALRDLDQEGADKGEQEIRDSEEATEQQ